jgi:hypothetical protein
MYRWTYDVADVGVTVADVDLTVSGGQDAAGNAQVSRTNAGYVDVDTRNPIAVVTVSRTMVSGGSPIYEATLVLTVTVTYDEAMNASTAPTIALQNAGTHWSGQTSLGWTGRTVYQATFTHDGTEEPSLPATATTAHVRVANGSGATDAAGNADIGGDSPTFEIDTRKPRSTVTVNRTLVSGGSPIYEGALALTVTATYDEAMDTSSAPLVTLQDAGTHWSSPTPLGWTGNTVYRVSFTHDGSEEPSLPAIAITAFARVMSGSGASDLAGNADVGDDSPAFEIDTRKPELTPSVSAVSVDTDPIYEGDLVQVVTVTFDEPMRTDGTAEPAVTFSDGVWTAQAGGVWSGEDTVWTRTCVVADRDEEVAYVTIGIAEARDAAGNEQEDFLPAREFTLDTVRPWIVRIDAEGDEACGGFYCSGAGDGVMIYVTFSEGVVLGQEPFSVRLDVQPGGFEHEFPAGTFSPNPALPERWSDYTIQRDYIVQAGHNSCDLESTEVAWTHGALTDVAGNLALVDMPPLEARIAALRSIIVDTMPPQAFDDPGVSVQYTYVQPGTMSWHEFIEDRERVVLREDCPIYIDVLTNDLDNCHAGLSVASAAAPAPSYGVTTLFTDGGGARYPLLPSLCDARVVRYSPYADYRGPDQFGYTARDCSGNTTDAMVYLYVFAKNALRSYIPNAFSGVRSPLRLETQDDLLLRIGSAGGSLYEFAIPDATAHGVIAWADDTVTYDRGLGIASLDVAYTSVAGYEGPEFFTWSVRDPFGLLQERSESFSVVRADGAPHALSPVLELQAGRMAHIAVPGGFFDAGGVSALRIERLDAFGFPVSEIPAVDVAAAIAAAPALGSSVLAVDSAQLPSGLIRLLIPVGDGMMCSVAIDVRGDGGR